MLKDNSVILFQGDSITDAGRTYDASLTFENLTSEEQHSLSFELGLGYPCMVKQFLDTFYRHKNITVLNRGISGDRTKELIARWDKDCIDLKPNVLSILIGINDTWRRYDANDPTTADEYENNFRALLTRANTELNCDIVIIEPFLLPVDPEKAIWRADLDPKIQIARKLAAEFKATYIPMDGIFAAACTKTAPSLLSIDGVHPTTLGHSIIAKEWIDAVI